VLDLPICRIRQIKQAIEYRHERRAEAELNRLEWQTRALLLQLSGLAQSKDQHKALHGFATGTHIRPAPPTPRSEDLPPGLDFDPEAEPDYSRMQLKPTEVVMSRMGKLAKPRT
jgi:hypothetical protein